MGSKKLPPIAPSLWSLNESYFKYCNEIGKNKCPKIWQKFLKSCGLSHMSLSRLEIVNEKKWFLAKIKYGI